jgi:hypothetical protein
VIKKGKSSEDVMAACLTWYSKLHALSPDKGWGNILQFQGGDAVELFVDALEYVVVQIPGL